MGEAINAFFEHLLCWSYDNGVVYFSGRDICCIITGFMISVLMVLIICSFLRKEDSNEGI